MMGKSNIKRVHIEGLSEADEVRIIVDDEIEPKSIEWEILDPPEARQDEEEPFSVITLSLIPWSGESR
ncbi:hypothetical protein GCM10007209_09420 [Haloferax sulfurifontis]|uniref:Uncharacterized protein n=1 Tax=Haloferax sulfurifontis TaxID=255616 RepID=A0A830E7K2_9EURY|nr:hypothetical protein GCM10007209_09420 [Haloferax sulfurifontis]